MVATDPASLLRRAERLLWYAESIAQRASDDENYRLLLLALDRATKACETLGKMTGLIDSGVNVSLRIGASDPLGSLSNAELAACISKLRHELAVEGQIALPAGSDPVIDAGFVEVTPA
jgi:hypothetical protein